MRNFSRITHHASRIKLMNQYANGTTNKTPKQTELAQDVEAFKPFLKAVGRGEKLKRDLTYEESKDAMRLILSREATDAQIGAFLISQRVKGEAVDEILGFTDVVRTEFIQPIEPKVEGLLDLGVPYDGKAKTAQLAPAIAFVLSAVGVPVVLHGDEGVPTKEGVSDQARFCTRWVSTTIYQLRPFRK